VTWGYEITQLPSNHIVALSCVGTLTLTQKRETFAGTFTYSSSADCGDGDSSGQVTNGTVTADGAIAFDLPVPRTPEPIPASLGCSLSSGSARLVGAVRGRALEAHTGPMRLDCDADHGGAMDLALHVVGTR
jgi:hypothetical protein